MNLQSKIQAYQTNVVDSVVDCFAGQPLNPRDRYPIDSGNREELPTMNEGFKNAAVQISEQKVLANIRKVQRRQNLPISSDLKLDDNGECKYNLDVEMETGTGKTYCYIKTIFEINKRYGWIKFASLFTTPGGCKRQKVFHQTPVSTSW